MKAPFRALETYFMAGHLSFKGLKRKSYLPPITVLRGKVTTQGGGGWGLDPSKTRTTTQKERAN